MSAQTHTAARAQKLLRRKGALTPLILVMGFIGASLRYLLECGYCVGSKFTSSTDETFYEGAIRETSFKTPN